MTRFKCVIHIYYIKYIKFTEVTIMYNTQYTQPNSNLYHAALTNDIELAKKSIVQGADPNYQEINRTVLQAAIICNNLEVAEYLLEIGVNPNKKFPNGLTPLMEASSGEMVRLLAEKGADHKVCDEESNNALRYYIEWDNLRAVREWLRLGWPVIQKNRKLLDRLLARGRFEMISLLTGYEFEAENTMGRIVEFKARYAV